MSLNQTSSMLLALFALPIGGALCLTGCVPSTAGESVVAPLADQPKLVNLVQVEATKLARQTTQPAIVHAYFRTDVCANVSGFVDDLKVDIGDKVKQGDVLAVISVPELAKQRAAKSADIKRLEASERRAAAQLAVATASAASYAAQLDSAKARVGQVMANVTAAQSELTRIKDLVQQRAVADRLLDESQKKFDAAQAEKVSAEAQVTAAQADAALGTAQADAARAEQEVAAALTEVARRELEEWDERLKYTQITAPFDGVITQRHVDRGHLVRIGGGGVGQAIPLFVIAQVDKVRIRIPLPERDASFADVGDKVTFNFSAMAGGSYSGTITRLSGELEPATRTMQVEVDLENVDGKLLPGMFGQATIELESAQSTVLLPANAVRYDKVGKSQVWVVNKDGIVEMVDVQTGQDDGATIEITAGITPEHRVIGPMLGRLTAGEKVAVAPIK